MSDAGPSASASTSTSTRSGGSGQQGAGRAAKPARLARSKAACGECHKAKQRCDGPPGPCHRCSTWGTDCIFPSAAGPIASTKSTASARSSTPPTGGGGRGSRAASNVAQVQAQAQGQIQAAQAAQAVQAAVQSATPDVAEQLRLMNARLESLESTLSRAIPPAPSSASSSNLSQLQPHPGTPRLSSLNPNLTTHHHPVRRSSTSLNGSESSPLTGGAGVTAASMQDHREDVGVNAVETAGEAMAVEGLVDLSGEGRTRPTSARHGAGLSGEMEQHQYGGWDSVRPDVLGRSIMTLEECDAAFDFYFEHLQPWTCLLSTTLDRHPLVVRERSPLLFHAILLMVLYYRPRIPANIILYRAVSSILDSILAPQILCPQPDQLSYDFVRAIHLVLMYKPLQWAALNAQGVSDPAQIESSSKMNVRASWILRLLVSRVSAFIGLPSIATIFAQHFASPRQTPIPDSIVSQTRLFLACVFHDSHGALQSGKAANFIPSDACKVTRLFATLKRQSSDVRLAASVELVALASQALLARKEDGVLEEEDLRRFDEEMESWSEYWAPLMAVQATPGAEGGQDTQTWSVFYPYASFLRLTVRGYAFNKWRAERKERAAQRAQAGGFSVGGATQLGLGAEERESIAGAVKVAEEQMLAVSEGGTALRSGRGRSEEDENVWNAAGVGSLSPDLEVVRTLKWASDSLTCVMFSYPLIFLAKLANEGLMRSDLTVIPAGSPPLPPSPMSPSDKLCRLFQLGADLLDAIAPNEHHPSVKQAAFLRKVWDAGISGRRSVTSAPSSPHFRGQGDQHPHIPPHLSLGAAAGQLASVPSPAAMPPPHPSLTHQHTQSHLHTIPRPPTLPPLPSSTPLPSSSLHRQPQYNSHSGGDISLSTTYNPTPVHSRAAGTPQALSHSQSHSRPLSHPHPYPRPHSASSSSSAVPGSFPANHPSSGGVLPFAEDPFAALLSGVSPTLFDDAGGVSSLFAMDGMGGSSSVSGAGASGGVGAGGAGLDWAELENTGAGMGMGMGGGFGGYGMQF
ncbi:hypothetical protein JCM11641_008082 [Rhodosporidiobolus odoratus]